MSKTLKILLGILFGLVVIGAVGLLYFSSKETPQDKPIAIVNGLKVTKDDANKWVSTYRKFFNHSGNTDAVKTVECTGTNKAVENAIIKTESAKLGITASSSEIDKKYQEKISGYESESKAAEITNETYGLSKDDLRAISELDILKEKLSNKVLKDYDLSYVLIRYDRVKEDNSPDTAKAALAQTKIQEVQSRLKNGEILEAIGQSLLSDSEWKSPLSGSGKLLKMNEAKIKSSTKGTADWNGIKNLKTGNVSEIVKSDGGYYVIFKADRVGEGNFQGWEDYINYFKSKNNLDTCGKTKTAITNLINYVVKEVRACLSLPIDKQHRGSIGIGITDYILNTDIANIASRVDAHDARGWCWITGTYGPHSGTSSSQGYWETPQDLMCAYDYWASIYVPTGYKLVRVEVLDDLHPEQTSVSWVEDGNKRSVIIKPINDANWAVAQFYLEPLPKVNLNFSVSPAGAGTVSGDQINCGSDCTAEYLKDTPATSYTASWDTKAYTFNGWDTDSDSTANYPGTSNPLSVSHARDWYITAMFTPVQHPLSVTINGTGTGNVTSDTLHPGIDCPGDCNETYNYAEVVVLTAKANEGSRFDGWSGDCSGTSTQCSVPMYGSRNVTATFTATTENSKPTVQLVDPPTNSSFYQDSLPVGLTARADDIDGDKVSIKLYYRLSTLSEWEFACDYDATPQSAPYTKPPCTTRSNLAIGTYIWGATAKDEHGLESEPSVQWVFNIIERPIIIIDPPKCDLDKLEPSDGTIPATATYKLRNAPLNSWYFRVIDTNGNIIPGSEEYRPASNSITYTFKYPGTGKASSGGTPCQDAALRTPGEGNPNEVGP